MLSSRCRSTQCMRLYSSSANLGLIKQLRERTGAPMHEVKAALQTNNWDLDAALKELQRQGLTAASKKASRTAAEGLIAVASSSTSAVVVEVNCETDFVARNPKFQGLVDAVANAALGLNLRNDGAWGMTEIPAELLKAAPIEGHAQVMDALVAVAADVRENVQLRRASCISTSNCVMGTYIHGALPGHPRVGRIGGVVALALPLPDKSSAELAQLANGLAMHVVATKPLYVSRNQIPQEAKDRQQAALRAQDPNILASSAAQLDAWYKEACLMEHSYLMDANANVNVRLADQQLDVLRAVEGRLRCSLSVAGFLRMEAGEGIEREQKDFAAEVAHAAGIKT